MSKKIIWILALILLVTSVHAIGIAPAKTTLDFEPGKTGEGYFRIITDEYPTKIVVTTEGELGKYIEVDKEVVIVEGPETWVNFKINLPEDLPPGERRGGIMVLEAPKNTYQENVVLAAAAIVHQVRVSVPYPGQYLNGRMYITNQDVDEPILFTIALQNLGREKVEDAKATLVIKGPTNDELAVIESEKISISPNKEDKFVMDWQTENPGSYFAEAVVHYGDRKVELSQKFEVGSLDLEIERIVVNNFRIGQIAKMDIYMRNRWNQPLRVDGRVEVFKDNKLISSFNTVPITIEDRSTDVMNAYWNTEGIDPGEYDISVKANYNSRTSEETFTSIVSLDDIKFKDFVSGQVVSSKEQGNNGLLIGAVIILIVLNILLFIYIYKKLNSGKQN